MVMTAIDSKRAGDFDKPLPAIGEQRLSVSHEDFDNAMYTLAALYDEIGRRQRQRAECEPVRIVVKQATIALIDPSIRDYVSYAIEYGRPVNVRVTLEVDEAVAATHQRRDAAVAAMLRDGIERGLCDIVLTHPRS